VNDKEEQLGVIPTAEAIRLAREAGMDLVEVAPDARPPVCRIMDYGKWRYNQQKKDDRSRANAKGGQLKELKFKTVRIGDNDLLVKINRAKEFLEEGNKVQFTLQFRGREMAHLELGRGLFDKVKSQLASVSKVERDSKMEGRRMTLVLQPERKKVNKPQGGGQASAPARAGERLNIPSPAAPMPAPAASAVPAAAKTSA
jgi:translation initiation factor IF-3